MTNDPKRCRLYLVKDKEGIFFLRHEKQKRAFLSFAIKINFKSGVNILKLFLWTLPQKNWSVAPGKFFQVSIVR